MTGGVSCNHRSETTSNITVGFVSAAQNVQCRIILSMHCKCRGKSCFWAVLIPVPRSTVWVHQCAFVCKYDCLYCCVCACLCVPSASILHFVQITSVYGAQHSYSHRHESNRGSHIWERSHVREGGRERRKRQKMQSQKRGDKSTWYVLRNLKVQFVVFSGF